MTERSRIPNGSREYLLDRADQLAGAMQTCSATFEKWGARRVMPSTLVPLEDVTDSSSAITFSEQETGRLIALRQDLTNQVRRIVDMELKHLPTPLKLFYIERVWRSRTDNSRAKEQIQAGVEWIDPGNGADAEMLDLAINLANNLTDKPTTLVVGHADLRTAWLETLDLKDAGRADTALNQRNLSLWQEVGDSAFAELPFLTLNPKDPFEGPSEVATLIQDLKDAVGNVSPETQVVIDPIGAAPQAYYSGIFFGVSSGIEQDPWIRGGRYDAYFESSQDAIGFTVDLDPLIE